MSLLPIEPTIPIGELRHRVRLQRPIRNKAGEVTLWANLTERPIWARVEALSGHELYAAQQVFPEADANITIRFRRGITADMRVLFGTRTYDIKNSSDIEERHVRLELTCVERPAGRNT